MYSGWIYCLLAISFSSFCRHCVVPDWKFSWQTKYKSSTLILNMNDMLPMARWRRNVFGYKENMWIFFALTTDWNISIFSYKPNSKRPPYNYIWIARAILPLAIHFNSNTFYDLNTYNTCLILHAAAHSFNSQFLCFGPNSFVLTQLHAKLLTDYVWSLSVNTMDKEATGRMSGRMAANEPEKEGGRKKELEGANGGGRGVEW